MSEYTPQIDDVVTVSLPGEVTRARIVKLVSRTAAIVQLIGFTTATKSHDYRKDDLVPVQYGKTNMNLMGWRAVSEKELAQAAKPEEVEEPKHVVPEATYADIFGAPQRKADRKKGAHHAA